MAQSVKRSEKVACPECSHLHPQHRMADHVWYVHQKVYTPETLLPPTQWADPDQIGESEYRAIHELCLDMWNQEHDISLIRGILDQFKATAEAILREGKL